MEKKKILFISSWFPNKLEPTNGNFVQRHAEAVSTLHHVEILHAIGDFNQKEKFVFDDQFVNGIRTLIIYYKNTNTPAINFVRRAKAYLLGFKKLQKPDLVHANVMHNNMLFAVFLKKKYKIPFVITEHWTSLQKNNHSKTSKIIIYLAKYIARNASYILPVSNNLKESLESLGIKTPMKVISNVVDTDIFNLKKKEIKKTFHFLHVSSLIPRKRPLEIIEAIHQLYKNQYNVSLEIGGDGDLEPLKVLIKELGAQNYISYFGAISYQEVAKKMQDSDCFVLFSDNETQGCVILESYACGKPVVATRVGGAAEFLIEGQGVPVKKSNKEDLYRKLEDVINHKINLKSDEEMRNYVIENFSVHAIAKQFSEIYLKVLR